MCQTAINEQDQVIKTQGEIMAAQELEVVSLRQSNQAWYHNPVVMVGLGLVAGVATGALIK